MPRKQTIIKQVIGPDGQMMEVRKKIPMRDKTKPSDEENKAEADKQFAAAKRTMAQREERGEEAAATHTNVKATTDVHKGLAPHDTAKPPEMEAAKTGLKEVTGDPHLKRVPQKTDGVTTDLVTAEPEGAQPQGGPLDEAQRARQAVEESGKGKRGKSRRKK